MIPHRNYFLPNLEKGQVYVNKQGNFSPVSKIKKMKRAFLPNYAAKQDLKVAHAILNTLENLPPSGEMDSSHEQSILKASAQFIDKVLSSYSRGNKAIYKCRVQMQRFLNMKKLEKLFQIDYTVLKKNPDFVDFVMKNHLHHRVDRTYQKRGIGFIVDKDTIYAMERKESSIEARAIPWNVLFNRESGTLDKEGLIQGVKLLAYGFEKERVENITLEPFKIITVDKKEPEYSIELVTAKPTYDLKNIGLGMFGHTWLRLYAPVEGKPEQRKVYSLGFYLPPENPDFPDRFEFLPNREKVTTKLPFPNQESFEAVKEGLENILIYKNGSSEQRKELFSQFPQLEKGIEYWLEAHAVTCSSFASRIFYEATGERFNGRNFLGNILNTPSFERKIDNLTLKAPKLMRKVLQKIQRITRGGFPHFLAIEQKKYARSLEKTHA